MTALCAGGGASQVIPGKGFTLVVSASLITAGLGIISPWLLPFAALLDGFSYDLLTSCTSDPPAMPSSADLSPTHAIGGILNPDFPAWVQNVHDALINWLWPQYCQCTVGAQPAVPAALPPPANVNSPTPANTPCWTLDWAGTPAQIGPLATQWVGSTQLTGLLPPGTQIIRNPGGLGAVVTQQLPSPPPTSITYRYTQAIDNNHQDDGVVLLFFDAAGNIISDVVPGGIHGTQVETGSFNIPPTTDAWALYTFGNNAAEPSGPITEHIDFYCGGATPGGANLQCCPTDPSVLQLLNLIYQLEQSIYLGLPSAAASLAEATVHAALTGTGSISVAPGTIGIKIAITTDNAGLRVSAGTPPYLWDRGFWVPIGPEGAARGTTRIVYNPQINMLPVDTNSVGWTTGSGVTISITELVRGP